MLEKWINGCEDIRAAASYYDEYLDSFETLILLFYSCLNIT